MKKVVKSREGLITACKARDLFGYYFLDFSIMSV